MADRLTVGRVVLVHKIGVRFPVRQLEKAFPERGVFSLELADKQDICMSCGESNRRNDVRKNDERVRRVPRHHVDCEQSETIYIGDRQDHSLSANRFK